ncbi:MAG: assembly factor cbp4 [Trizodia sp. TS-e1964]|nr:MAG: assembly factor cbp4 [Trizodia sp. TS-e1964]
MHPKYKLWAKMFVAGTTMVIGGPALVMYVSPTEEELFKKYNPELQKRSLENREQKQQEFNEFVARLKEYSKSDKPIWVVAAEEEKKRQRKEQQEQKEKLAREQKLEPEKPVGSS